MLMTTQDKLENYEIVETLGLVQGNTVQTRHVGRDIMASFKTLVGGEITGYTELLQTARKEAIERMMMEAQMLGANAVVAVRFETSDIMQSAAELFVYGTAVKVK